MSTDSLIILTSKDRSDVLSLISKGLLTAWTNRVQQRHLGTIVPPRI